MRTPHQATVYVDYQQRAREFSVGDMAYPLAGAATDESQAGRVVAVFPGIGQVDIEFPWGSGRYPVEDVQRVTDIVTKAPDPDHTTVPGGVGTVGIPGGPVEKRAALAIDRVASAFIKSAVYWAGKDRSYRATRAEAESNKFRCPRCRVENGSDPIYLRPVNYKREDGQSHQLFGCPACMFLIKRDRIQGLQQDLGDDGPQDGTQSNWDGVMEQGFNSVRNVQGHSRTADKGIHQKQYERAGQLSRVDPSIANVMVESGSREDKISVSKTSMSASSLKPSQTTMVLPKSLGMALLMLKKNQIGGDLGALVSSDKYIMDGHHRWSAAVLAGGSSAQVGGYVAKLPGEKLVRVLNLLTKGEFKVGQGNAGSGNLGDYTSAKVRKMMTEFTEKGIPGKFPWSADDVKSTLENAFGSVDDGIKQISDNAKLVSKKVPSWAPPRSDMPVIDPAQVPKAVKKLQDGDVDWHKPYKRAATRDWDDDSITNWHHQILRAVRELMPIRTKGEEAAARLKELKVEWNDVTREIKKRGLKVYGPSSLRFSSVVEGG